MHSVAMIAVGSICTASNGNKAFPAKYEKNATNALEISTQVSNMPSTRGAFFLNDNIPVVINEKTINGNKKLKHSLKITLILYKKLIVVSLSKLPKSPTKIKIRKSLKGKDIFCIMKNPMNSLLDFYFLNLRIKV